MIPIYAPPKKSLGEVMPPSVTPPGTIGWSGYSKHNSIFDGTSIWFANTGGSSVYKFNTTTLQFQEFPTNSFRTTGIAFDGTYIYTTGFSSQTITKLDLNGNIVGTMPTGTAGDHQIIYDSQTDALFYTAFWTGSVIKYSKTGGILRTNAVGRKPLGIVALGDYIYVSCFDFSTYVEGVGRVVKLEKTTLGKVGEWIIGNNPSDITTDGTNLWVSSLKGGYIYKVSPADGTILATYNTGIPDTYQTTIRHIGSGFNVLAVTVTQDYQPDNIAGTYNKVHFLRESDGSSFLVADAQGVDLRNGSIDQSNWVWFGGYADGSVTRIHLESDAPLTNLTPFALALYSPVSNLIYAYSQPTGWVVFNTSLVQVDTFNTIGNSFTVPYLIAATVLANGGISYAVFDQNGTPRVEHYLNSPRTIAEYNVSMYLMTSVVEFGNYLFVSHYWYAGGFIVRFNKTTGVSENLGIGFTEQRAMVIAEGFLWVLGFNHRLAKVDPNTFTLTASINPSLSVYAPHTSVNTIAYYDGSLYWVTENVDGSIIRLVRFIIATSATVEYTVPTLLNATPVVCGTYLALRGSTGYIKFDLTTHSVTATIVSTIKTPFAWTGSKLLLADSNGLLLTTF